jgi:hypothetical protein
MSRATLESPGSGFYEDPALEWGVGKESDDVLAQTRTIVDSEGASVTRQSLAEVFRDLAETWRHDTATSSSALQIATHPAYLRIIGLGNAVIPFILADLEERSSHWFLALTALTGVDPVEVQKRGRIREMTQAWLNWGRRNGY